MFSAFPKIQPTCKNGCQKCGRIIFDKNCQLTMWIPWKSKFCTVIQDKCVFAFYAEFQDSCQKWQDNNFWKKCLMTAGNGGGQKFHRNCSVLHHFPAKCIFFCLLRWPPKVVDERFLEKIAR